MLDKKHLSEAGISLIKEFETLSLRAYPDPKTKGPPWTVGWGATGPNIEPGTVWTLAQADARLASDIAERERVTWGAVRVELTQGQFDAFVSILFNVGAGSERKNGIVRLMNGQPSTLLRRLNESDFTAARAEFLKWVSPGSRVENGLRRRREAELALYDQ